MSDLPDASWIQSGGVVAFASLVWYELRLFRMTFERFMVRTSERIARIEERDRIPVDEEKRAA